MAPTTEPSGYQGLSPIDPLIHFKSAAKEFLGLSPSTAYRLIRSHNVPIVQLGRKKMIRRSKFMTLVDRIESESGVAA